MAYQKLRQHLLIKKISIWFGYFYQYWGTTILLIVLISLAWQNFGVNKFPNSLAKKQKIIDEKLKINENLSARNKEKMLELEAQTANNMEILESRARYQFWLIKAGETYYQIKQSADE